MIERAFVSCTLVYGGPPPPHILDILLFGIRTCVWQVEQEHWEYQNIGCSGGSRGLVAPCAYGWTLRNHLGALFRGCLLDNAQAVLQEVKDAEGRVVLFIDEAGSEDWCS